MSMEPLDPSHECQNCRVGDYCGCTGPCCTDANGACICPSCACRGIFDEGHVAVYVRPHGF